MTGDLGTKEAELRRETNPGSLRRNAEEVKGKYRSVLGSAPLPHVGKQAIGDQAPYEPEKSPKF